VFTGFVLLLAGFFAPGRASLALCIAGMAMLVARTLIYKRRGVRKASIDGDGDFSDTSDSDGHGGGNGGDGHH
jgi:hypothetical protein